MLSSRLSILAVAITSLLTDAGRAERPQPAPGLHDRTVDDFERGDRRAASGLSWIAVADDLMGGASFADVTVTTPGARSRHALRVAGEVAERGFAGAWVALDGRALATDVSDYDGIRLRIRGSGAFQLGVRCGVMPGFNYMAPVEGGADWAQVTVPFASLRAQGPNPPPIDLKTVRFLGISTRSGRAGRYQVEIDDVELYTSRDHARLRAQEGPTFTVHFDASPASVLPPGACQELAQDPPDDGKQKRLPDATALAVCPDDAQGRVWFRIDLAGPVPRRWMGANIALDLDGDPDNGMAWWGTNRAFHFDRLVSVYGSEAGSGYEGTLGIADAAEVRAGNLNGSRGERVLVVTDAAKPAFLIGIPKSALATGAKGPIRLVAAVGSAFAYNNDVPNEGAALLSR